VSIRAIEANPELLKLRDEGLGIRIRADVLLIHPVPYLDAKGAVQVGTLAKGIQFDGSGKASLGDHTMYFIGGMPHNLDTTPMDAILADHNEVQLGGGTTANMRFSSKPPSGKYDSVDHQVRRYVAIISNPAREKDSDKTPWCHPPIADVDEETPFLYPDSSSTRAGIRAMAEKLAGQRIAIVGLGGTGAHILDAVAKTHVREIHLFDGDHFEPHSAFRAPGAASLDDLKPRPKKADFLASRYSVLKRNVIPHPIKVTADNLQLLAGMTFVFLAIDDPPAKRPIIDFLNGQHIPFVDVGMGIHVAHGMLDGTIRSVRVLGGAGDAALQGIATAEGDALNDYSSNIQVAELGALNAALAVIHWKKAFGFYVDDAKEHQMRFVVGPSSMVRLP
jgi:hypothetical protein